jgi:hypothetical protein
MTYADVSVVLNTKFQKMSTISIKADITMNSLYPLTYLLFQHGSLCQRRINSATELVIYRCFLLAFVIGFYMCYHCFSASMPAKNLMMIMFMVLISPLQLILFGFSHRNVGFQYLYRIYGEYKRNFMCNLFNRLDLLIVIINAASDATIYHLINY